MIQHIYFIVVTILIIIFIFYKKFKSDKIVEGLNTFVGRMAIDDQYFYDKTFDDVFYYPNTPEGITGWEECLKQCPGNCVEYGQTGHSYCFPY